MDFCLNEHFFSLKFYLFLAVLGLYCCEGFSVVGKSWGSSLAVHELFIAVVSLVVQHRLLGIWASVAEHVGSVVAAPRL